MRNNRTIGCFVAYAFLAISMTVVSGQPHPPSVLSDVEAAMHRGDHSQAIDLLKAAIQHNPNDAALHRTLGEAYVRLQLFDLAYEPMMRAGQLGDTSPQLFQLKGDVLLAHGEAEAALAAFQRGPQTARNRLGRAAALVQLGQAEDAIEQVDQAITMDLSVEAQARLIRASALASLNRQDEAQQDLQAGQTAAQGTGWEPIFDRIGDRLEAMASPTEAPDWGAQFTLGVGYNDNVVLRPDKVFGTLPPELSDESDAVFTESLSAWKRFIGDARSGAIARASISGVQYPDQDDFNQFYLNGGVLAYHSVDNLRFELGVDLGYANVDGDTFSGTAGASATIRWQQTDRTRSNLTYRYTFREFDFDVLAEEDRDGSLHVVTFVQDVYLPINERTLHLMPYAEFGLEDTDGASSENDFWAAGLRGRIALTDRLTLFGGFSYRDREYDNPHIRSGFTTRRDDELWQLGGGVQYALSDKTRLTLAYQHLDNDSNLPTLFAYEQNTVMLAITFLFGP